MFTHNTPTLIAAVVVAGAAVPATAQARFDMNPPRPAPVVAYQAASETPSTDVTQSNGFQWGDAGIGAASVLALIGAGGTVTIARRRRVQNRAAR
jgi:hypothetical protein